MERVVRLMEVMKKSKTALQKISKSFFLYVGKFLIYLLRAKVQRI